MKSQRFHLSRRTVLRGAGAAIALPLLDAMTDGRGRIFTGEARAAGKPPVRLFTWYWPNGCRGATWWPSAPGPLTAGMLTAQQQAFAPVAGRPDILPYLNIVGGLDNADIWKSGHNAAMFAAGTGGSDEHNNFGNWPTAATIDQVCADRFGKETKLASLPVSAVSGGYGGGHPGWAILSWKDGGRQVQPYANEKALFDTLFGGATTSAGSDALARAAARRKSVLDFVADDSTKLAARLGAGDKQRVDEHLTALRALEKQIEAAAAPVSCDRPPGTSGLGSSKEAVLMKLVVLAWKCDLSRYGSFMLDYGSGQRNYSDGAGGDHDLSHNGSDAAVTRRTVIRLKYFADMLRDLAEVKEGDGTLLDNSIIYCNTDVSDGRSHSRMNMPVVVAGRAGGALKAGRYVKFEKRKLSDLFCSLVNYAGVPLAKYGSNGTGPLAGF